MENGICQNQRARHADFSHPFLSAFAPLCLCASVVHCFWCPKPSVQRRIRQGTVKIPQKRRTTALAGRNAVYNGASCLDLDEELAMDDFSIPGPSCPFCGA